MATEILTVLTEILKD